MERNVEVSLLALTVACTFAAALFGLGSSVFAWRSVYEEQLGHEQLIVLARLLVYLAFALLLVFRGGWRGVLAAIAMVVGATLVEWALWPVAYEWAAISDPAGFEERFGENVGRPTYGQVASFDVLGVSISSALAQGLRMMAHVNPKGPRDG